MHWPMVVALVAVWLVGCSTMSPSPGTALQRWMATSPMYIAHRGGDADWTEGTADAYAHAAAWNPSLALEVPVWRTSDGIWVISEDPTTGRVFGTNDDIKRTPWAALAALRTLRGHHRIARLVDDVLAVYPRDRVIFVDDKPGADVSGFLSLLNSYGGPARFVVKTFWKSEALPQQARKVGYITWGYYYAKTCRTSRPLKADSTCSALTTPRRQLISPPCGPPANRSLPTSSTTPKPPPRRCRAAPPG